jgi:hypothetical protein
VRRLLLLSTVFVMTIVAAGCGGDDSATAQPSSGAPQTVEYELPQVSDIGLHPAFVTFTALDGDATTAVVDFSVERTEENSGRTYAAGIYAGACDSRGELERDLGKLPAGINTVTISAPYDDVVENLVQGASSIAVMEPDGTTVGWCGPV